MKSGFPARLPVGLILCFATVASVCEIRAQVGNDNPTGVSGMFNGNVTTGCNYDPYTANAMRGPIVDITIAGAVGKYGLAFSRAANSRSGFGFWFGMPGAWKHPYEWGLSDSLETTSSGSPNRYQVSFPDGRYETFQCEPSDTVCGAGVGVRERFQRLNTSTLLGYLLLADGGKVEFTATLNSEWDPDTRRRWYWYSYVAQAIIDPYGLRTTFTYGTNTLTITEPAGRYLTINYGTVYGAYMITSVQGSDGRTVQYTYGQSAFPPGTRTYVYLSSVNYYSDPNIASATYTYQAPNVPDFYGSWNGIPLLSTCNDPMYDGPMKRISYTYQTTNNPDGTSPVYGQIRSENYPGGPAVSTLTVNNSTTRTETRADGKTRTFTYSNGYCASWTDFMDHSASQTYDANHYINSVTDRNNHTTDLTRDALTGNITLVTYPLTQGDTPGQTQNPTVSYTYGSASCADANNRDPNNPYWVCTATDEGGHVTQFYRDTNHRVTQINYPDGGYETFAYNSFGEVTSHRMTTGGTETLTYDASGNKLTYRNPSNASGNPTAQYQYEGHGWVSGITDALNNTTNFSYNTRGQVTVTTHPTDPVDGQRHTITNAYNSDGTLASTADELGHVTSYTYDDYRRRRSMTTPTSHTASYFYDVSGIGNDYTYTESNVTFVTLPSGKRTNTIYDENRRKSSVTVAAGTSDAATTSYGYDNAGNLTTVTDPLSHVTTTAYDERNRPSSITDALNNTTYFYYDLAGRKKTVTRPNGQVITYEVYDQMNRLKQERVTQTPDPDAVTKYTYTQAGLLATMQDPRLVALNSSYTYTYAYDTTGRKTSVTYPPDSGNVQRTETFAYDTAGRLQTFTNRNGKVQTFTYDALNRLTGFSWNDGGVTPSVSFGYDVASRLASANNVNATISRTYFNDNLLNSETESVTGGGPAPPQTISCMQANSVTRCYNNYIEWPPVYQSSADACRNYCNANNAQACEWNSADGSCYVEFGASCLVDGFPGWYAGIAGVSCSSDATVTYTYDADGNRASVTWPDGTAFNYSYTGRNQLRNLTSGATTYATYGYNVNGDLITRALGNGTSSSYTYDALDRVTHIAHALNGTTRTFDYAYDSVGNRKWTKRDGGNGDVFGYDYAEQVMAVKLDIPNPDTTSAGAQTIVYDANGNRTSFSAYGPTDTYTLNNLNQYSQRNGINAAYDNNGNLVTGVDGSSYTYDAQNRLTNAYKNGVTETFKYDGLNRQVTRTINGVTTYNIWDGWDLIEEYQAGGSATAAYLNGVGGLVENVLSGNFYYQDGSGSTSHLADSTGHLLEWYRYDLQGTPVFYNAANTQIPSSNYGIRHLFTGQQWYSELGLYDLRNRFYSPDIGRFLQPDPIGFDGDPTNLYCYVGNNPVGYSDPTGLFRGGQFAVGAALTVGGFIMAVTTAPTLAGLPVALAGGGFMLYGIDNVVGSFSNDPAAVAALSHPTSFSGLAGRAMAGETGQVIGDTLEDVIGARAATTTVEKAISAASLAKDAYDAGRLLSPMFKGAAGGGPSGLANFSPRYVFQGGDSGSYAYFDNSTGREWVVGYQVPSPLSYIGDHFDFYSPAYDGSGDYGGYTDSYGNYVPSFSQLGFSGTLGSVFQALGGGGVGGFLLIKYL